MTQTANISSNNSPLFSMSSASIKAFINAISAGLLLRQLSLELSQEGWEQQARAAREQGQATKAAGTADAYSTMISGCGEVAGAAISVGGIAGGMRASSQDRTAAANSEDTIATNQARIQALNDPNHAIQPAGGNNPAPVQGNEPPPQEQARLRTENEQLTRRAQTHAESANATQQKWTAGGQAGSAVLKGFSDIGASCQKITAAGYNKMVAILQSLSSMLSSLVSTTTSNGTNAVQTNAGICAAMLKAAEADASFRG